MRLDGCSDSREDTVDKLIKLETERAPHAGARARVDDFKH